jgi:uncharacterized protein (DUF983 family)
MMGPMRTLSFKTLFLRGLRRRCPICGERRIFRSWFKMLDDCPRCHHHFEREEGYWVSAIIVNTAATEALFGIFFIGGIFATLPEVRWLPLLVVGAVTNLVFPVLFYPFSKTIWVALDVYFHPLTAEAKTDASRRWFGTR